MRRLKMTMVAGTLALAACGGQTPERAEDAREAEGEVLGGSIGDDMLPLDQVRSQSPQIRERTVTQVEEDGSTTVETTVNVTSGEGAENQPAPPQPPASPEA